MMRMHCNEEVLRLPSTDTHIIAVCQVCGRRFEQRKRRPVEHVRTMPDSMTNLVDLRTGAVVDIVAIRDEVAELRRKHQNGQL